MNRMIDSAILDDEYVLSLGDSEYRVWMQLLLNTNKIGIAKQPRSISAFRCQKQPSEYIEILKKLESDGKILVIEEYVAILNHYKFWDYSTPNGAISAIKELEDLPGSVKLVSIECIKKVMQKIVNDTKNSKRKGEIYTMLMAYGWDAYGIDIASLYHSHNKAIIDSNSYSNSNSYSDTSPSPETIRANVKGKEKKEVLAKGIYMSQEEQLQFREKYGDKLFLMIPEKVSEWARSSGVEVKNGYIMCCQFADKEVQNGKSK